MTRFIVVILCAIVLFLPQTVFAKSKIDMARDYVTIGKTSEARQLLNQAILGDPLDADVHYEAGLVYSQLEMVGDFDLAMKNACKLKPSYCPKVAGPYCNRGYGELRKNSSYSVRNAIRAFNKALTYDPSKKSATLNQLLDSGKRYFLNNDKTNADKYFSTLTSLDPSFKNQVEKLRQKEKFEQLKAAPIRFAVERDFYEANGKKMDEWQIGIDIIENNNAKISEVGSLKKLYGYDLILLEISKNWQEDIYRNIGDLIKKGKVVVVSAGYGTILPVDRNHKCTYDKNLNKRINCITSAEYANRFLSKFNMSYKVRDVNDYKENGGIPWTYEIKMNNDQLLSKNLDAILSHGGPYIFVNDKSIKKIGEYGENVAVAAIEDNESGGALIVRGGYDFEFFLGVHNNETKKKDYRIHKFLENIIRYTRERKLAVINRKLAALN